MADTTVSISADGKSSTYSYGAKKQLDLNTQLDAALGRCNGDAAAAAALFLRWSESDSAIGDLIPPVVEHYIRQRIEDRAESPEAVTGPDPRVKGLENEVERLRHELATARAEATLIREERAK